MSPQRRSILLLSTSIAFAVAILIASAVISDAETSQFVVYSLIAVWFIPFGWLSVPGKRRCCAPRADVNDAE